MGSRSRNTRKRYSKPIRSRWLQARNFDSKSGWKISREPGITGYLSPKSRKSGCDERQRMQARAERERDSAKLQATGAALHNKRGKEPTALLGQGHLHTWLTSVPNISNPPSPITNTWPRAPPLKSRKPETFVWAEPLEF